MSKTRLKTFGNGFRLFCNFENFFDFFENFRQLDPQRINEQKNFFGKTAPKLVQNTFGHFWERFRAFLQFLKIFDFFENFRRLDPP